MPILEDLRSALAGRYAVERELGGGGMAVVLLAQDVKHHRAVAIKVLRPELAAALGPGRFLREIEIAARLTHPHILPLYDSGEAGGLLYYVTPYIEGESLRHRLKRESQLPLDDALAITRQVAAALSYAHGHDVVHRDIKPENILLQGDDALVADFGIARAITAAGGDKLTESGIAVGTPAYMSPEQALAERTLDGRSDVYSLGCVLYEMLAGQPPYTGATAQAVMARRLTDPVPSLRTVRDVVPAAVEQAIGKALARAPADRFATATQFVAALRQQPGDAKPAVVPASWRPRRVMTGVAMALAAAIAAFVLWPSPRPAELDPDLIAVAPFDVLDPKLAVFHEGLVDMLSRNLDGAGPLRTVSPTVILHQWSGRGDPASATALGRRTGARLVVFGQLIGLGADSVRLKASLLDAASARVQGERERVEHANRIDPLVDSITVDLLRDVGRAARGQALRLGSVGTTSLPALKAFLQGQRLLRRGAFDSAATAYQRAISLDSTFALAYHGLVQAIGWVGRPEDRPALAQRASALNRGLAPRDSLLITAEMLGILGDQASNPHAWSDRLRYVATLEAAVQRYPEDPELWYLLGDAWFHAAWAVGASPRAVRAAFDRAIAVDSTYAPAYLHQVTLALHGNDTAAARGYVRGYLRLPRGDPSGHGFGLVNLLLDPARAGSAELARLLDTASANVLFGAFDALNGWRDSAEVGIRLLRLLSPSRRGIGLAADTGWTNWLLGNNLATRGHLREARAMEGNLFGNRSLDLAFAGGFPAESLAVNAARWMERPRDRALISDPRFLSGCDRALGAAWWWATRGDTGRLAALAARAGTMFDPRARGLARQQATVLFVGAGMALARRDTAQALRRLRALPDSLCPDTWYLKLARFQLLAATGSDREAAAEFDRGMIYPADGATGVLATLERGRVAERLGDRETAVRMYGAVLDAWRHADPELQPYVAEARGGVQRLGGEPRP